jgi:uncharacterized protein YkwD
VRALRGMSIAALVLALGVPQASVATAGPTAPSAARGAVGALEATASVTAQGRLRLSLRTSARSVQIKYVVAGRSTRSMTAPVRRGLVRVTLPASATSVRVRAAATSSRRATAWTRVPISALSELDQPPSSETIAAWEAELLTLVNGVRAAGYTCPGGQYLGPAPALGRNPAMDTAARNHSAWMAEVGRLSHDGRGGSSLGRRLSAAGYPWHRAAENVAAGRPEPSATLAQWLGSAGHCRELMNPASTETGIGYAYSTTSLYRHFWTQDFATP